jgi:hypothetical protein
VLWSINIIELDNLTEKNGRENICAGPRVRMQQYMGPGHVVPWPIIVAISVRG